MNTQVQNEHFMVLNSQELEDELADDGDDDDIVTKEEDTSVTDEDTGFDICLEHPLHPGTVVMYVVVSLVSLLSSTNTYPTQVQSCTSLQA